MVNPDSDLRPGPPRVAAAGARRGCRRVAQPAGAGPRSHDGAYAHVLGQLDDLLANHAIDYLKWDHNRDLVDAGHHGRRGVHRQTLAVYRLLDELRARHPGARDRELRLRRRRGSTSASSSAPTGSGPATPTTRWSVSRSSAGPGCCCRPSWSAATWARPCRTPPAGGTRSPSVVATAVFGHLGFEVDLAELTAEELEQVTGAIAFYRRHRALLHSGDVVRVDHHDSAALVHGVVAADRREAVFAYVQLATGASQVPGCVRLAGLDPRARYRVTAPDLAGGPAPSRSRRRRGWRPAG